MLYVQPSETIQFQGQIIRGQELRIADLEYYLSEEQNKYKKLELEIIKLTNPDLFNRIVNNEMLRELF